MAEPGREQAPCDECGGTGLVRVITREPPDDDERECRSCAGSGREATVECSHMAPCTPDYRCSMHRAGREPTPRERALLHGPYCEACKVPEGFPHVPTCRLLLDAGWEATCPADHDDPFAPICCTCKTAPREQTCDSGGYGSPDYSDDPAYQAVYGRKS